MASQGPNPPGTGADDAGVGTVAWSNPGNCAASDNAYAQTTSLAGSAVSHWLLLTDFGFTVPAGATVDGIEVAVERGSPAAGGTVADSTVKLWSGGAAVGDNKAAGGNWPNGSEATVTYGGAADVWGAALSPAAVNAAGFGVAISIVGTAGIGPIGRVDLVTVTVYYTAAAAGGGSLLWVG